MAEVIGVVASGIAVVQVAVAVGKSVIVLRELWAEVKEVPDTINDLMQQVEAITPLFGMIEQNLLRSSPVVGNLQMMNPAMEYARKARDEFAILVSEVSRDINTARKSKRTMARIKVVMSKKLLAKYEGRLRGAIQFLSIAQQASLFALTARLPDMILERITPIVEWRQIAIEEAPLRCEDKRTSSPNSNHLGSELETLARRLGLHERTKTVLRVQAMLPRWVTNKAYTIAISRAISGWQAHFSVCNVISADSRVFQLAAKGDMSSVLEHFKYGLATLHDVDEYGWGIFDYAVYYAPVPSKRQKLGEPLRVARMARSLHTLGVRSWKCDTGEILSLLLDGRHHEWLLRYVLDAAYERRFGSNPRVVNKNEHMVCYALAGAKDIGIFESIRAVVDNSTFGYHLPYRTQVEYAVAEDTPLSVMPSYITTLEELNRRVSNGGRALWYTNGCIREPRDVTCAHCSWYKGSRSRFAYTDELDVLRESTARFLSLGDDAEVQGFWYRGGTELICQILRMWDCIGLSSRARTALLSDIRTWLKAVQANGVDLEVYGELVASVYESGSDWVPPARRVMVWGMIGCMASYPVDHQGNVRKLTNLTFGPQPDDWNIIRSVDFYDFAGDFWDLIEDRNKGEADVAEIHIPGAWVEH